jgi:hypothetical protein
MNTITPLTVAQSEMVRQALRFWFEDQEHIRSPFPRHLQPMVAEKGSVRFAEWLNRLHEKAKDEVNDEVLAEKFEEILFQVGLELAQTEDERISLLFPFLPRIGDQVVPTEGQGYQPSNVTARKLVGESDTKYLHLSLREATDGQEWETQMELPA